MRRFRCVSLALLIAVPAYAENVLPSYREVRAHYLPSDGRLLDRNGELLQELRLHWGGRALDWVKLSEMSPALRAAIVEVEDQRFYQHGGVDYRALLGAAWQKLAYGSRRGASTITMQTVNLLEAQHRGPRTLWRKVRQGQLAWELESAWSKDQILEAYLNLVSFRGEHRGIGAAARALFGKDPHGLELKESYLLATLLRAPAMSAAAAGTRLCRYAKEKPALGSCEELKAFARQALGRTQAPELRAGLAPHLARHLLSSQIREQRSTVELRWQQVAWSAVRDQLSRLRSQNVRDAAVVVVDNRTAEVRAYVGGAGDFSAAPAVDMAESRRQAGSTLKPFLYGLTFEKGLLRPESWVLDEPFEVGLERGSYEPDNYDHQFHGPVPVGAALASSLNIPAVRVLDLVGVETFRSKLAELGFRALEEGEHYGPSLALGTADVTLVDLVQAYAALANDGVWRPLRFRAEDPPAKGKKVFSRETAREITAILSDRSLRSLTFGWDSLLATPYPTAAKTGTSKDMRDNWCVGYSKDFTVGVWVGNGGGDPMWAVSGVEGAAPVWRAVMDRLHKGRAVKSFSLAKKTTAPTFERGKFGRILYPASGAVLAIDPDIPEGSQRVLIEAEGEGKLFLNGNELADPLWKPSKGKHRIQLSSKTGAVLDELSFEVR